MMDVRGEEKMIDVTCAIIRDEEERILIVQRGKKSDHSFKWEFPGGKCRQGETFEDCILREIREELSMEIVICGRLDPVEYDYGIKKIRLIPFVCDTLTEQPELNEHIAFRWLVPSELTCVDFLEADVMVAEQYLALAAARSNIHDDNGCRNIAQEHGISLNEQELIDFINRLMSMKEADWLAGSALIHPALPEKLLEYSSKSDNKLAFRASWVLTKVYDKYPELIQSHLQKIIRTLPDLENESVIRSFMKILSFCDMKTFMEEDHGLLADYCLSGLISPFTPIAIKAYAMEILYRLTVLYPQLGNEVAAAISSVMEEGSPGIKSKGKTVLRRITGITSNS